jgi:hypothetical protein
MEAARKKANDLILNSTASATTFFSEYSLYQDTTPTPTIRIWRGFIAQNYFYWQAAISATATATKYFRLTMNTNGAKILDPLKTCIGTYNATSSLTNY